MPRLDVPDQDPDHRLVRKLRELGADPEDPASVARAMRQVHPEPRSAGTGWDAREWAAAGAAAAITIGSLGTWATVGPLTYSATSSGQDGKFTLALGILALLAVAFRWPRSLVGLFGGLAAAIGIVDAQDLSNHRVLGQTPEMGWGLLVVIGAGGGLLVWTVAQWMWPRGRGS